MLKLKRILSVLITIALLAGLFVTPAFADSGQSDPDLQTYLNTLGAPYTPSMMLPDGQVGWAYFDRGQLVYGFPWDVVDATPGYSQEWKPAATSWQNDNDDDYQQAPSSNTDWANGLQFQNNPNYIGPYTGEPRYIGYDVNRSPVSNENFPPDTTGVPMPAQCQMIKTPWSSVIGDPDYQHGNGWPGGGVTTVYPYTWGVIVGAIADCYKQFGFTAATDSFTGNPAFSAQNGGLTPTNIENYFELLTMPEPGIMGSVRFWNTNPTNGGAYYKTIEIPWPLTPLPNYYVTTITPFSGTQTSPTAMVNGQTAAVYNQGGSQNIYTGTVTFGTEPDGMTVTNAGAVATQLWSLVNTNSDSDNAPPVDGYYAPVGVCVNAQNNFATITDSSNFQAIPTNENAGGPQPDEGTVLTASGNGTYTAIFTWSVPQSFSGTSMPIGAGINDGWNDFSNATTDIMPDDVTNWYADFSEINLSDNFSEALALSGTGSGGNTTASDVPVVGATQPALLVTPSTATIPEGAAQQYTDQYYPQGVSQGNPQDETTQSSWSDANSDVASIGASTGLATGEAAGNANITAIYTPPGGSPLNATAALTVTASQTPSSSGGYTAALSFAAVNQPEIKTMMGQEIGGTLQRAANTAMWTDTVTATLAADQQPDVSSYVPSGGVVQSVVWSISDITLTYPAQNPDYTFGNPVEPTATTSTSMTAGDDSSGSGHQATASFEEKWSEDGIGYGSQGPYGIHDTLTNSTIAASPVSYPISAAFTLSGTVSGYVPTQESTGNGGTIIVDVPFSNPFTLSGTAEQDLKVDGTGAVPMTSAGQNYMVGSVLNPGGVGGETN